MPENSGWSDEMMPFGGMVVIVSDWLLSAESGAKLNLLEAAVDSEVVGAEALWFDAEVGSVEDSGDGCGVGLGVGATLWLNTFDRPIIMVGTG